jgi:hypothetical protein
MYPRLLVSITHRACWIAAATAVLPACPTNCFAQSFSLPNRALLENPAPSPAQAPPAQAKNNNVRLWGLDFKNQVERCWKRPQQAGKEFPQAIVSIKLKRDGMIEDIRRVSISPNTPYAEAYLASCLRALRECQPYKLPQAYYDEWRFFEPVFTERYRPGVQG